MKTRLSLAEYGMNTDSVFFAVLAALRERLLILNLRKMARKAAKYAGENQVCCF